MRQVASQTFKRFLTCCSESVESFSGGPEFTVESFRTYCQGESDLVKFHTIIPSALDDAGISDDYFRMGNLNLLPMGSKTLIQYLIDDLNKPKIREHLAHIDLIVAANLKDTYGSLVSGRGAIPLEIHTQQPYEKKGVLITVDSVFSAKDDPTLPLFIIYGDTLVQDDLLQLVFREAENLMREKKNSPWGVVVLCKVPESDRSTPAVLSRNRFGHIVVSNAASPVSIQEGIEHEKFSVFTEEAIQDVINRPAFPRLLPGHGLDTHHLEAGILILSPDAWKLFIGYHERDPLGFQSITNALRRSLIDTNLRLRVIVAGPKQWLDVNYPWEYLIANDYLLQRIAFMPEHTRPDYEGFILVESRQELVDALSKLPHMQDSSVDSELMPITRPETRFSSEYDESVWRIHRDAVIDGSLLIPDPDRFPKFRMFLGRNSVIRGRCVIKDGVRIRGNATVTSSVLCESVLVDSYCLVDHSVIMADTKVLMGSVIPYSIVGEDVILGGQVMIACESAGKVEYVRREKLSNAGGAVEAPSKYYGATTVVPHSSRLGAIIGDGCRIGMGSWVFPGRKIGMGSRIEPGAQIVRNCPQRSTVSSKRTFR
jgi:NDP-sugar pyrophosphorylase family protein